MYRNTIYGQLGQSVGDGRNLAAKKRKEREVEVERDRRARFLLRRTNKRARRSRSTFFRTLETQTRRSGAFYFKKRMEQG